MIERTSALLLTFLLAACATQQPSVLDRFVGCWTNANGTSYEIWVRDGPRQLIGFAVTVGDQGLRSYEQLSLKSSRNGTVLTAYPGRQSSASFELISTTADSVRFENPTHDFPQWIAYRWQDSALLAEIGILDSDQSTVFRKMRCEDGE